MNGLWELLNHLFGIEFRTEAGRANAAFGIALLALIGFSYVATLSDYVFALIVAWLRPHEAVLPIPSTPPWAFFGFLVYATFCVAYLGIKQRRR